ncbi:MAG: PleD family two-component system response regulator [Pseudomonadota bacterium]
MTATILVVDDLEPNVKLLEAKLLGEYYTVFTANGGQAALDVLARETIDIVLLDVMMPGMDGFETCKLIKSNPETLHIPVVMVTALSEIEDRVKALEAGADEFLTKPVNDVALFARVKSLSRTRSVIDELKIRNKTNAEIGGKVVDFTDNFTNNKILLINDDVIQSKNIVKTLSKLTAHVQTLTNMEEMDKVVTTFIPDVIIISCQIEFSDPLRIVAKLRGVAELKQSFFMLYAEEENINIVIRGLEIGVNDYFIYPVDENELLARIRTQLRRKKYQDELRQDLEDSVNLSIKDGLTGIFNRRYFDTHIEQIVAQCSANQKLFSLLMIDMDHFKKVNDEYGHQAGDEVLKFLTTLLSLQLRATDLFARYGGEEFVIVLCETDIVNATTVAERIRAATEAAEFKISAKSEPLHKTLSMGLAEYRSGETAKSLIERADSALYEAKESGRNKVILAK